METEKYAEQEGATVRISMHQLKTECTQKSESQFVNRWIHSGCRALTHFFLILLLAFSTQSFAQTPSGTTSGDADPMSSLSGTRKQIATIVFAGLAGAVMGLSTLSFYGRPQDKLSNIAVGFAVGVIIGTGYTTYKAATKPREMYDSKLEDSILPYEKGVLFSNQEQSTPMDFSRTVAQGTPTVLGYTWSFE